MVTTTGFLGSTFAITTGNAIVGQTASATHKFGPSFIFARGALTLILLNGSDNLGAGFTITKVVDEAGTHHVQDVCVLNLKTKSTSVTYSIGVGFSEASLWCVTELFE